MIGNVVGAKCVVKEPNGREYECHITEAVMNMTTGCYPELNVTMRLDTVSEAHCVPPWERRPFIEGVIDPPYIPTALVPSFFRQGTKMKAKQVIYNPPATVVLWADGTKTVVKCDPEDTFNETTGVALCYMKKALGNTSRELNKALRKAKGVIA